MIFTVLGKIDEDLVNSVVTNSTKFSDFDLTDEEMDEVILEIGVSVKSEDNLVDIAKKMRDNA